MTTYTTIQLRDAIFHLLRTRTINYGTNIGNPYYIHSLVKSVPEYWDRQPSAVPFSQVIRFIIGDNGDKHIFWNEDNLIFDWEMMKIFHKKYVNNAATTDPLSMYLSILTAIYVLIFESLINKQITGDDMNGALRKYQKIPPMKVDLNFRLPSDHPDFELVKGTNLLGVIDLVPNFFDSFNILRKLKEDPEIEDYVRKTYGAQMDPTVAGYDAAHFWISHFQTVYNFYNRWHDKK